MCEASELLGPAFGRHVPALSLTDLIRAATHVVETVPEEEREPMLRVVLRDALDAGDVLAAAMAAATIAARRGNASMGER